ncbi:uncharacterized protein LOC143053734 [Mytilus galloprovincialis]|uniref:uncharacterized protein LOC143053734 n=1 Tax=Mytilus galloprovincialis TaxID=29158 RepID=UPI003F7CD326
MRTTTAEATWDDWSSWSKCSRSCGSGSQTRQRQCLNQINDTDGFVSDCDGVGTNLRSCNTEPCPYCDDTKFQYRLQKPLSDLKDDTGSGSGYLITNGIFTVNCCGRIKLWEFMPVKAGSLKFIVVRKTEGGKYRCVGSNVIDISESDLHKTAQIRVSDDERIAVTQGDIIGWFGSGHIIGYYECIPSSKPCPVSLKLNYSVSEGDTIDLGTLSNSFNRIYALNYSTIANRAVTIAIPSKPVTIPDHLMVDSFVMTIPIYDPDYGDFILDFKLDYNNDYFYLDTKLRSVHAKNPLPHVIGQKNTTLNFICTVQDSCFNLASTTITIISYNVPPVITELPDILRIDLQQLQEETSFHIFHVEDPSNDTVSCALSKISPTTDALIFKMDGNEPIVKTYIESEMAYLTCSEQFNEQIEILSINYTNGMCIHNEIFGVKNICNGKTSCSFNVTNSNIGSSCGANGNATLEVEYTCRRNGGWSDWNTSASCPLTCGGAFRNVTRTCSNPYPNEGGRACTGESFEEQLCSTNNCIDQDSACLNATVNWNCQNGNIEVNKAVWEASKSCGVGYTSFKTHNVIKRMQTRCNIRTTCSFIANDHNFGVSCSTAASKCTIFEYVYTCIKATWDEWSTWSECSKSCGSGIKFRKRQCLNQMNTTDGYISECEGLGTDSRSCNSELCPYCNESTFQHTSIQSSRILKADTSSGSGYLLLSGIYSINCCGRIKLWEFTPVNTGRLTFVIMRKTTDIKYKCVGANQIHISATNLRKSTQFNVSEDKRIAITQGDVIGWFDGGSNIVGFHDCLQNNDTCPLSYRLNNGVDKGDVVDIESLSRTSGRSYSVNYSTSENRRIAVDLPSEPITIPDHFTVDSFVITIPINDPDNGDYIQDVKLDYDNTYFYFDTKLRSVHVKKTLPHVVGQRNTTLNIVVTFEDSCFNFASANITITSFNAPPEVSGFTDELIIDPTKLSNDSRFHIFNVEDPSDDNIFCGIKDTSHSTDTFVLEMEDNDAYLRLSNHSLTSDNSSSEYELKIFCDDGTDETTLKLTVKVGLMKTDQPNDRIDTDKTDIHVVIIGICASVGALFVILFIVALIRNCRSQPTTKEKLEKGLNTYMSSIDKTAENPYNDMEQTVDQQKTYIETSADSKH